MKKFIYKFFLLLVLPVIIISVSIILLPPDESYKKSFFYALIDKNYLLEETKSPRIIFVGSSDISYGLNSQFIKDSLKLNPINTAITGALGLKFILANTSRNIKENDIIVLSVDYTQFYDDVADGKLELISVVFDVMPSSIKLLDFKQALTLCTYVPQYLSSKTRKIFQKNNLSIKNSMRCYERISFNSFGDAYFHWKYPKQSFRSYEITGKTYNDDLIPFIIGFNRTVNNKKAKLFLTFQCLQDSSFDKSRDKIYFIQQELKKSGLTIISHPERYRMNDSLFFDDPNHLNKKGVNIRTTLLINDIKKVICLNP